MKIIGSKYFLLFLLTDHLMGISYNVRLLTKVNCSIYVFILERIAYFVLFFILQLLKFVQIDLQLLKKINKITNMSNRS